MQLNRNLLSAVSTIIFFSVLFVASPSFARRPLTTQSAYPEKVHRVKLETGVRAVNFPHGGESNNLDLEVNYGVINNLDVGVEIPYVFWRPKGSKNADGLGDMILKSRLLFLKGREGNPISLTIQPFFKIPTPENEFKSGEGESGFSTGETDFGFVFIATREMSELLSAHMNVGYTFINKPSWGSEYENVFLFKLAVEYSADKEIQLVGEVNGETNKVPHNPDFFSILLGARYKIMEGVLLDAGFSVGISDASPDSATVGLTIDF
ncbi:MAG: transporter [Nitrospirae bacterium]|nr:transporter [Nitrospirota bacterium]